MEATTIQFQTTPEQAKDTLYLRSRITEALNLEHVDFDFAWKRRSIDARKREIKINCTFTVYGLGKRPEVDHAFNPMNVAGRKEVAIIGSGPAGLFA